MPRLTTTSGQLAANTATPAAEASTPRFAMMSFLEQTHVDRMLRSAER